VWDSATGRELITVRGHTAEVCVATYLPGGKELAVLDCQGFLKLWDAQTGGGGLQLRTGEPGPVAVSPDGQHVAVADGSRIRFHAADTGALTGTRDVGKGKQIRGIAYAAKERLVVVSTADGPDGLPRYEIARGPLAGDLSVCGEGALTRELLVALSSNGRWVAVREFGLVRIRDLEADPVRVSLCPVPPNQISVALALAPDGRLALSGTSNLEHQLERVWG
jgi:hypothetical protein